MSKQRERDEFMVLMAREVPEATPHQLAKLCSLSVRHCRLQERACNEPMPADYDRKLEKQITSLAVEMGCVGVVFSGDPRGCTVRLKVKSGRTNDWEAVGVCVPQ